MFFSTILACCLLVANTFRLFSSIFTRKSLLAFFTIPSSLYGMKYCTNVFSSYGIIHVKSGWFSVYTPAITEQEITDYLAGIQPLFDADPLKEILIQKYIAQTRDEQIETYNDIRRCNYVDGGYPVGLTNPNNTSSAGNRWPLRLPYGESDVQSNPNVAAAFGTGNEAGNYIFTENVWWAGGSR